MTKLEDAMSMAMHTAMQVASEAQTHDAAPIAGSQNTVATRDPGNESSTVTQGAATPPPLSNSPAEDARSAAGLASDPLATLKTDPEYQKLTSELGLLSQEFTFEGVSYSVADLIKVIDGDNVAAGDNIIQLSDLQHTAYWQKDNLKAFAARILQDPKLNGLLVKLADGYAHGTISIASLTERIETLTTNKNSKESAATGAPSPNEKNEPTKFDRTKLDEAQERRAEGKKTGEATTAPEKQSVDELIKFRPFSSTAKDPGERMSDCVGHLQDEIDRLYASMTDQTSQADMSKIQGQISKLQSMMQMVMSAMQQQQQMMSNIAKMWSDMAMNAIRNMH